MRAVIIQRQGTPVCENVKCVNDWPEPDRENLTAGQVIIRSKATALNHLDLWMGRGLPGMNLSFPRISGSDICGVVESIGADVNQSWLGKKVILNAAVEVETPNQPDSRAVPDALAMIGEHTMGTHCQLVSVPVKQLVEVGDEIDANEAAAFGLSFLTAWKCLITRAELRPAQIVLITGIGGGVAISGLAIAKHLGCRTIVTSRHQWKLDKAKELGADDVVLDDGSTDWSREVRQLTGKRGVDIALDSIGKKTHLYCIKSLARGGTYTTPGCTTGPDAVTDLARIFWNQLKIVGSTMGNMNEFHEVCALFRKGALQPVIDSVYPANEADQAYQRLESGEHFGKVVIDWR